MYLKQIVEAVGADVEVAVFGDDLVDHLLHGDFLDALAAVFVEDEEIVGLGGEAVAADDGVVHDGEVRVAGHRLGGPYNLLLLEVEGGDVARLVTGAVGVAVGAVGDVEDVALDDEVVEALRITHQRGLGGELPVLEVIGGVEGLLGLVGDDHLEGVAPVLAVGGDEVAAGAVAETRGELSHGELDALLATDEVVVEEPVVIVGDSVLLAGELFELDLLAALVEFQNMARKVGSGHCGKLEALQVVGVESADGGQFVVGLEGLVALGIGRLGSGGFLGGVFLLCAQGGGEEEA